MFSDSVRGVKASANLYSLIETAKANGLEPYAYLRHVFTELPNAQTVETIEALLPGNIDMEQIKSPLGNTAGYLALTVIRNRRWVIFIFRLFFSAGFYLAY